jgi:NAD(P)H-hydrate epimerase
MKVVTAEEMKALEEAAIQKLGVPSLILMEHAGKSLAMKCMSLMEQRNHYQRVWVFVGKGNNGGDGLVAARHLLNAKIEVRVILLCDPRDLRGDAQLNYEIMRNYSLESLVYLDDLDVGGLGKEIKAEDLVIDAIYGTGFMGTAFGIDGAVIRLLSHHQGMVISADLPSGMEANTGQINGPCVKANYTLTFGLPKLGLYRDPDHEHSGQIEIVDIGLPCDLGEEESLKVELIHPSWAFEKIPVRKRDSHKGRYGHVFVVGGSPGMTGAVTLACQAALANGSGLVTAGVPASLNHIMEVKLTEVMTKPLPEIQPGDFSQAAGNSILDFLTKASALVIGPGMGTRWSGKELLNSILPQVRVPMVIDADGLNLVAEILKERSGFFKCLSLPVVLTPHPGEMARLTGLSIEEIESDRVGVAMRYAQEWQCSIVLKGAYTVIASPTGRAYLNTKGNAGMATAGSGDVLAGIIGSFIGQGMESFSAAALGVYLHGISGDLASEGGMEGVCASHLIENLSGAFRTVRLGL